MQTYSENTSLEIKTHAYNYRSMQISIFVYLHTHTYTWIHTHFHIYIKLRVITFTFVSLFLSSLTHSPPFISPLMFCQGTIFGNYWGPILQLFCFPANFIKLMKFFSPIALLFKRCIYFHSHHNAHSQDRLRPL